MKSRGKDRKNEKDRLWVGAVLQTHRNNRETTASDNRQGSYIARGGGGEREWNVSKRTRGQVQKKTDQTRTQIGRRDLGNDVRRGVLILRLYCTRRKKGRKHWRSE